MATLPQKESSLWREAYNGPLYDSLRHDITVDVAIVGAGITGLTTAYLLKKSGKTIAVIDKDTVGGGTSGRTTGKVSSQHSLFYDDLRSRRGEKVARLYGEANQSAIEKIESIIHAESIECDWTCRDNLVYTDNPNKVEQFKREAATAAELGLPAHFETSSSLPFPVAATVRFSNQASMSTQKYLLGLAAAVHGNGSYVFEHTKGTGFEDGSPCRVKTPHGTITATDIVMATNVPSLPLMARGGYCMLEYPSESYLIAAPYDKSLEGMYISPDPDHYSILPVRFQGTSYLLIGGDGHLSGLRVSKNFHYKKLAAYAERQFGITQITHKWSDRDYLAYDEIPLIGKLYPWSEHLYVGTAFKKWGLTNGTVAGMVLSDLINGKENPWAAVFTPQRASPLTSIPRAVVQQATQTFNSLR